MVRALNFDKHVSSLQWLVDFVPKRKMLMKKGHVLLPTSEELSPPKADRSQETFFEKQALTLTMIMMVPYGPSCTTPTHEIPYFGRGSKIAYEKA